MSAQNLNTPADNIDPSLQEPAVQIPPPPQPEPSLSPTTKRRRLRQSQDSSVDGHDDPGSPRAKRPRPSAAIGTRSAATSPAIHHDSVHAIPTQYSPPPMLTQPPTAPMAHTAQMNFHHPAVLAPPRPMAPMLRSMPNRLLPPRHDTASSLTSYLMHIFNKTSTSFIPPLMNTSFTLPWTFGIPRKYCSEYAPPGSRKYVPIRDLLYKFNSEDSQNRQNGDMEGEKNDARDLEALVSLAKQSMDSQNWLMKIATSIVKLVQSADGFDYVHSTSGRTPSPPPHSQAQEGLLGGDWEFVFVCSNSEESRSINGQQPEDNADSANASESKYFACEGKIGVKFLEKEETIILTYRHCAVHRQVHPVERPVVHTTPTPAPAPIETERTIVGGVVSRKPMDSGITSSSYSVQSTYTNGNTVRPQQGNEYVLHNGTWYLSPQHHQHPQHPQHQQPQPQHDTSDRQQQHYQQTAVTHHTNLSADPGQTMAQIYQQGVAQASVHRVADSAASTEQRLLEELSRELNSPQHQHHHPQQQHSHHQPPTDPALQQPQPQAVVQQHQAYDYHQYSQYQSAPNGEQKSASPEGSKKRRSRTRKSEGEATPTT